MLRSNAVLMHFKSSLGVGLLSLMFVKLLRSTPQMLRLVMFMFTALLQSMLSPLEIGACIAVVDVSVVMPEITREVVRLTRSLRCAIALASLFIEVCDWHVPRITPCRYFHTRPH